MKVIEVMFEPSREQLSQTIVECLISWPESQRRVFVENHYCGKSADDIARALNLQPAEVVQILAQCELKLHHALKVFRDGASPGMPQATSPLHSYPASCCFH